MNKSDLIFFGVMSTIGAVAGWGLSFTSLSPAIIGGVIGFINLGLITACGIGVLLYTLYKENGVKLIELSTAILISSAAGVGFGIAANAIFPGVFETWWALALGAGIGTIASVIGFYTTKYVAAPVAEKVNEYIIYL